MITNGAVYRITRGDPSINQPALYTVGYWTPKGDWEALRDYPSESDAAEYCNYLNGGRTGREESEVEGIRTGRMTNGPEHVSDPKKPRPPEVVAEEISKMEESEAGIISMADAHALAAAYLASAKTIKGLEAEIALDKKLFGVLSTLFTYQTYLMDGDPVDAMNRMMEDLRTEAVINDNPSDMFKWPWAHTVRVDVMGGGAGGGGGGGEAGS